METARHKPQNRRILDHPVLGSIEHVESVEITCDGHPITAQAGETVAAALLAAGVRVFRSMPRAGELRGGYCFVGRCSDCLMVIDGEPNQLACQIQVRAGMRVERQHGLGPTSSGVAS